MSVQRAAQSWEWIRSWPRIRARPPLYEQRSLSVTLGLAHLFVKDESARSGLGSFKVLGAPIALVRQLCRLHSHLEAERVLLGEYRNLLGQTSVICATDGNHGKALAAAAHDAGCPCVIVLHAQVSDEREAAIAEYGARIVRVQGNYDHSVAEAARLAAAQGWHVISDTSYQGYEEVPLDVMQGYAILAAESVQQSGTVGTRPPWTHVLLQGGVGGLAAGVLGYLWERFGENRPHFIVVEPQQADCLYQSALAGKPASTTGTVDSLMAGLACGEASPLAWRFLQPGVDAFLRINDEEAVEAMRLFARGGELDSPIVSGESGAAGLAGLLHLCTRDLAAQVGLDQHSSVLVINTEGATSPGLYRELVGETAEAVLARQQSFAGTARHPTAPSDPAARLAR